MKHNYLALLLLPLACSQNAVAQQKMTSPQRPSHFMKLFDGNDHDGIVTRAEFNAVMKKNYQTMDTDNNGKVSLAEFKKYHAERRKSHQQAKLNHIDQDKNGFISRQEFTASAIKRAEQRFNRLDKNQDGQISTQEYTANYPRNKHHLVNKMDKNKDAQISFEEYTTMSRRWFDRLDSNQDNQVTINEIQGRFPQ